MATRKKFIRQWVPAGPTVVWKKHPRTGKWVAVMTQRKGYWRTVAVNA